jgi:hypothetical protein
MKTRFLIITGIVFVGLCFVTNNHALAMWVPQVFAESNYQYFTMDDGSENLTVQAAPGSIVQLPIHLKTLPEYEYVSMNLSFSNEIGLSEILQNSTYQYDVPKIKTWINPYNVEFNGQSPTTNTVSITVDSDVKPGTYTIDIIGNGALKKKNSDEYIPITAQIVGEIKLDVISLDSKIKMSIGNRTVHMGSFCIDGEGFDQMCGYGPTYEEYPIALSSESKAEIKLKASNVPSGAWIKFVPDTLSVNQDNTTAKMILAGYEMPFQSSQDSIPLTITAESQADHAFSFIPIIKNRDITVIKSTAPIKLVGQIPPNNDGVNFNTYGVVYDPEDSKKSIDVKLDVLGIIKDGTIQPMPAWLKVDIPVSSFTLRAAEPYYFIIKATTKSAPLGLHNVAIKETIGGQEFIENVEIYIPAPIYTVPSGRGIELGGPKSSEPITPTEAVQRSSSEHVEAGTPLVLDASSAFGMGVVLAGIFGSITIVVILKSKSRQKY